MAFFGNCGFRMHYEIHPGLVPSPTIFLHGNLASNNWWKPSLEVWKNNAKDKGHKGALIFAEWRGCGKSTGPEAAKDLQLEVLANDYVKLLERLEIKEVNLVGHSTGGLIGLFAIIQNQKLFQRAVLLDSVAATGIQFGPEMYEAFTRMSEDRALCSAVMGGTINSSKMDPALMETIIDDAFNVHPLIWHGIPNMLKGVDYRDRVKTITTPTLVLHGELDTLLPIDGSKELASLLPNGRFHEIPKQGHSCNMENPELFVNLCNEFLFG